MSYSTKELSGSQKVGHPTLHGNCLLACYWKWLLLYQQLLCLTTIFEYLQLPFSFKLNNKQKLINNWDSFFAIVLPEDCGKTHD